MADPVLSILKVMPRRNRNLFDHAKRDASGKMKLAERMCVKIGLLRDFYVFHSQCNYFVQNISKGIQEVKETYSSISEDMGLMLILYVSHKLSQLISSLDSLLRDLMSAERLLQACGGKKWKRAAIVLSMPPPELEKYTGSSFLLLIRDFNWSLDIVRHSLKLPDSPQSSTATEQTLNTMYASNRTFRVKSLGLETTNTSDEQISGQIDLPRDLSSAEWKFKWCHRRCRYKLQSNVHDLGQQAQDRENRRVIVEKTRGKTSSIRGYGFSSSHSSTQSERKEISHVSHDQRVSERKDEIREATEARSREDDVDQQASDCKDVSGVTASDREESLKGDFDRQAQDRQNLPGIVEKHMSARAYDSSFSPSVRLKSWNPLFADKTPTIKFLAVVKNRCQDTSGSGSANSVSKCFEIDHLDLKMKNKISSGASKRISRANWLGQEVAVAVVKHIPRDVVEKEAGFLVKVHHPNVVDFFGFALKEEALTEEEMASAEKIEPKWTGYLVMELMQEDLRSLIEKLLRGPRKQESGGPFSLSITVDILLQIVGAMIHTHKFDILHRDLKAKNCLVNPKPVSSSKEGVSPQYYTVKLIDFGDSKLWATDGKQTLKKGTVRWMAPEVWESSEYSKSADVYSFGMTCYEVVTGLIPFQGISHRVMDKVLAGVRPTIPGTCPQSLSDLMKKCWAHPPEDRPTFEELHKDLWGIKSSVDVPLQL